MWPVWFCSSHFNSHPASRFFYLLLLFIIIFIYVITSVLELYSPLSGPTVFQGMDSGARSTKWKPCFLPRWTWFKSDWFKFHDLNYDLKQKDQLKIIHDITQFFSLKWFLFILRTSQVIISSLIPSLWGGHRERKHNLCYPNVLVNQQWVHSMACYFPSNLL